jgi:hypothetical protein
MNQHIPLNSLSALGSPKSSLEGHKSFVPQDGHFAFTDGAGGEGVGPPGGKHLSDGEVVVGLSSCEMAMWRHSNLPRHGSFTPLRASAILGPVMPEAGESLWRENPKTWT